MSTAKLDKAYQVLKKRMETLRVGVDHKQFINESLEVAFQDKNMIPLKHALYLQHYPVHPDEFLFGDRYLKRPESEIYPVVRDTIVEVCDERGRVLNRVTEFVGTGGIGVAKTTVAQFITLYQLYLLSCYRNPHIVFGLDTASEILIIFQSLKAGTAKAVDYGRFRKYCEQSPYFTETFKFDKNLKSQLVFPNRIECKPMASDNDSIGLNVVGGIIDEINDMQVIKSSSKTRDSSTYDQAKVIYDGVSRRIKSRFLNDGGGAGVLCLVSSRKFPEEFTEKKIAEAVYDDSIYVYDKKIWDVKPQGTYSPERFSIYLGDDNVKPKIIEDKDVGSYPEDFILEVPLSLKSYFEKDMLGALRDIGGVSTISKHSFFLNQRAIDEAFIFPSVLTKQEHDFSDVGKPLGINTANLPAINMRGARHNRWIHLDLSKTNDSTGIACGYISHFTNVINPDGSYSDEVMPVIKLDFILRVTPPPNDEIRFYKIRELLYKLKELGLPIKWVSFDSYQSVDSIQILRRKGFSTGNLSVDTSTLGYELTKTAIYQKRLEAPPHEQCVQELKRVELVKSSNGKVKVDHPHSESKDCADAVAGVIQGLSTRRDLWYAHGVSPTSFSETVKNIQAKAEHKMKEDA